MILVVCGDDFHYLSERSPGLFGSLQVISFIQTFLDVMPIMGQIASINSRLLRRVRSGQSDILIGRQRGTDGGAHLLGWE